MSSELEAMSSPTKPRQLDPVARAALARQALVEIIESGVVPMAAQVIRPSSSADPRQWVELLLRPTTFEQVPLNPADVVHEAEVVGQGPLLDERVLDCAIRYAAANPTIERVSINLTQGGLSSPRLSAMVLGLLDKHSVDPGRICLELSEMYQLSAIWLTRRELERLRKKGVHTALDDIGGGHANLRLCAGELITIGKIDHAVVYDAVSAVGDPRVLYAIASMLKRLDLEIVVEGVEDEKVERLVRDIGPCWLQGYHVGAPKLIPGAVRPLPPVTEAKAS